MEKIYPNFTTAINAVQRTLLSSGRVYTQNKWQALNVKGTHKEKMYEALHVFFHVAIPPENTWVEDIKPNLPWADLHLEERVGGVPLNPPPSHTIWPFAQRGNQEFGGNTQFSHTYPERIWPVWAGNKATPNQGIRYEFGDLGDLIKVLLEDPQTRQAFLPIWFPEDLSAILQQQRVPCTIGYHFIQRNGVLHVTYWIRSCDFFRHFRDDIYLAVKLAAYILAKLKAEDPLTWGEVKLGLYTMHIVNLHIFEPEVYTLKNLVNKT